MVNPRDMAWNADVTIVVHTIGWYILPAQVKQTLPHAAESID